MMAALDLYHFKIPEGYEPTGEYRKPKTGEFFLSDTGNVLSACGEAFGNRIILREVPKPEPVVVPWDMDAMPERVKVKRKNGDSDKLWWASPTSDTTVVVGIGTYGYRELLDNFVQSDGSPCGVVQQ